MVSRIPRDVERSPRPTLGPDPATPETTAVGTFAAGQSPLGDYHVATEAQLGSFASGPPEDIGPAARPRRSPVVDPGTA